MFFFKSTKDSFDKTILNSLGEGILVVGENGICRYANDAAATMLGYDKVKLLGSSMYDTWFKNGTHRVDCTSDSCPVEATLADKKKRSGECVFVHKDMRSVPVQCISSPLYQNGKVTGAIISFFDISEQKELERITKENKDLLETEFNNLPVGCVIWSDQFAAITWNPMCEKIFGYSAREALGKKPSQLFVPKDAPPEEVAVWSTIPSDSTTRVTSAVNRTKDGRKIYCQWNLTRLTNPSGALVGVLSTVEDITESVLVQHELQKTLEDLRVAKLDVDKQVAKRTEELATATAQEEAILESIGDSIVAVDKNSNIIFANHVALETMGVSEKDIIGKPFNTVWDVEDEQGKEVLVTERHLHKAIEKNQKLESSKNFFVIKNKNKKFPVATITAPIIYNGSVVGAVQAIRDITKEKELEHAKSDFVSIASHQLRTPLSSIRWVLDVLKEEKLTDKQKEYVDSLYASNQRLVNLVDDLLNTSRIESGNIVAKKVPVNLKETVDAFIKTLKPAADKKKQEIKITFTNDPGRVTIDTKLFEMAFNNLLSNAISYSPESLPITIVIENGKKECHVSVNNLKPYISEADKPKIFSKFYRAEEAKKIRPEGTGLGIFIAKSSVETSGGKMWFDSDAEHGTTFHFTIPTV